METIKSSKEISDLFSTGKRIGTPTITLVISRDKKRHDQHGRAAFIAGKKHGNAVWRNRAKRRMRAVCKDLNLILDGYDVAFLAKQATTTVKYEKLVNDTRRALTQAGLR